jgi:hypothetical protein
MKTRSIYISILFLVVLPFALAAQAPRTAKALADAEPPRVQNSLANASGPSYVVLTNIVATNPVTPLGPRDVLKQYEREMTLIAQRVSIEMASISQAQEANQVTREQAEYLIQETYQAAMMQFQTVIALHDALGAEITRVDALDKRPAPAAGTDTMLVIPPPFVDLVNTHSK